MDEMLESTSRMRQVVTVITSRRRCVVSSSLCSRYAKRCAGRQAEQSVAACIVTSSYTRTDFSAWRKSRPC